MAQSNDEGSPTKKPKLATNSQTCPSFNWKPISSQSRVRAQASGQTIVTIQPSPGQPQQVLAPLKKPMWDNVKKCKNFLSTLIKLAHSHSAETVKNVQALIQGLIDGRVKPEAFTERLQHELQSAPQPYLVPFLKKNLPLLRQSMQQGRMTIEGVNPPPVGGMPRPQPQVTNTPSSHPSIPQSQARQQVITATGTLTQRPVVSNVPQHKVLQSPGPASSKLGTVRPPVATQLAIAPGGNKVMVPAQPRPRPPHPITHPPFRNKAPVIRPSQVSSPRAPHTPVSSSSPSTFASKVKTEASASPIEIDHEYVREEDAVIPLSPPHLEFDDDVPSPVYPPLLPPLSLSPRTPSPTSTVAPPLTSSLLTILPSPTPILSTATHFPPPFTSPLPTLLSSPTPVSSTSTPISSAFINSSYSQDFNKLLLLVANSGHQSLARRIALHDTMSPTDDPEEKLFVSLYGRVTDVLKKADSDTQSKLSFDIVG